MLVAGVGYRAALDLGLSPALADDAPDTLSFGSLEPLVALMQETPADKVLPALVARLNQGTSLKDLVAAAALANARAFGGEDYIGFHTLMALGPAFMMSQELPSERRALPVLKVLYRNTNRLQEHGGRKNEVLGPVQPATLAKDATAEAIRNAVHGRDLRAAEQALAAAARVSPEQAYNDLLETVEENDDVHRIVLAHRAWDLLDLVGRDHALTMLRQSLHYCVKNEEYAIKYATGLRTLLPKMLDQHHLPGKSLGTRDVDDAWIDATSQAIFKATPEQAADMAAGILAEGIKPSALGDAIAVAANQLVLRDVGRVEGQTQPNKPLGSVHGDSIGVHACDSAHAWRNIARVASPRNTAACLIAAAHQVALDRTQRGGKFLEWQPRPFPEQLEKVASKDAEGLLKELDTAIREQNQAQACAVVHRFGELGHPHRAAFDVLLKYATSEDGALHAEKYYRTTSDEFATLRPAFRWRQLVALARVTASEYGQPAPGYAEACRLLEVKNA
jgi:hypothetical protein